MNIKRIWSITNTIQRVCQLLMCAARLLFLCRTLIAIIISIVVTVQQILTDYELLTNLVATVI